MRDGGPSRSLPGRLAARLQYPGWSLPIPHHATRTKAHTYECNGNPRPRPRRRPRPKPCCFLLLVAFLSYSFPISGRRKVDGDHVEPAALLTGPPTAGSPRLRFCHSSEGVARGFFCFGPTVSSRKTSGWAVFFTVFCHFFFVNFQTFAYHCPTFCSSPLCCCFFAFPVSTLLASFSPTKIPAENWRCRPAGLNLSPRLSI